MNKLRSALTVLGIVVGVASVVCMVSVGAGAQAEVSEKFAHSHQPPAGHKVSEASAMPTVENEIETLLRQRHHIRGDAPSDLTVANPADVLTAREAAVRTLGILLISVASVSLVVGGISIMNVMLIFGDRTHS